MPKWNNYVQTTLKKKKSNFSRCCYLVTKSCATLCGPIDCSMPGFPALHYHLEFLQIHGPWDAYSEGGILLQFTKGYYDSDP